MASRNQVFRVLDANANRSLEGLRVCEDLVRFCLGWASHVRRLRALRHAIATQVRRLPLKPVDLVLFRDSRHDLGRRFHVSRVRSLEHLLLINLQRTKEALRVLEETSRLIAPRHTGAFQRLRFQTYDVERALLLHVAAVRHRRQIRRLRS